LPYPPPNSAIEDIPSFTANAERCLQKAEKRKFTTMGSCTVTTDTLSREDVLRTLRSDAKHLQMWAICPYGGLGPMFRRFLFGDDPIQPLSFSANKPYAARCTVTPSKAQLPMASFPLQIPHSLLRSQPTSDSMATPTLPPPLRSISFNSLASPAPRRLLSTSVDQFLPSRLHRRLRDQPEPLQD